MDQLYITKIFEDKSQYILIQCRGSLYKTVEAIKANCKNVWDNCMKHYNTIHNDIIAPMNALLKKQMNARNKLEQEQQSVNTNLNKKKSELAVARSKYLESFKKFDENMDNYLKSTLPEPKRVKIAQQIKSELASCKQIEKNYKETISGVNSLQKGITSSYVSLLLRL